MTNVLTYGTFDLLHYGHVNLLRRAKALGDVLYVGLSTDEFNETKHKTSFYSFEERKSILEAIRYVDCVFEESNWEQKLSDVRRLDIDVFVMGCDWRGEFDFLLPHCKVVYLDRTPRISSSMVKKNMVLKNK